MIANLNDPRCHLFITLIAELTDETRVRVHPPDEDWHRYVARLTGRALNVCQPDRRESGRLRFSATVSSFDMHRQDQRVQRRRTSPQ
jgi:hypothetical protein